MIEELDHEKYEFLIASDVVRDGLGVEVYLQMGRTLLCEIFRSDAEQRTFFTAYEEKIPFAVIERIFEIARARL